MFDGHGGGEVAQYVKRHYEQILKDNEQYKSGDFKEALRRSFLKVDESLLDGGLEEVGEIKKANPPTKPPIF